MVQAGSVSDGDRASALLSAESQSDQPVAGAPRRDTGEQNMITHTAAWRLHQVALTCGHSTSIRAGEHTAWCSWCGRTVSTLVPQFSR